MTIALEMVPMPGTSRSGIQRTITRKLTITSGLAERDRQVLASPEWSTSHGATPEVTADHERDREAVEHQADVELGEPAPEPPGPQLRDRAEVGEDPGRAAVQGGGGHGPILPRSGLSINSQSWESGLHGPLHHRPPGGHPGRRLRPHARPTPASRRPCVLLIGDGRIPAGTRLPSERELTEALGVSRTTVTRAYATVRDARVRRGAAGLGHLHPGAGRAGPRPRPGAAPPPERPAPRSTSTAPHRSPRRRSRRPTPRR